MIANPLIPAFRYDPYTKRLTRELYEHAEMRRLRGKAVEQAKATLVVPTTSKDARDVWAVVLGTLGRQGNLRVLRVSFLRVDGGIFLIISNTVHHSTSCSIVVVIDRCKHDSLYPHPPLGAISRQIITLHRNLDIRPNILSSTFDRLGIRLSEASSLVLRSQRRPRRVGSEGMGRNGSARRFAGNRPVGAAGGLPDGLLRGWQHGGVDSEARHGCKEGGRGIGETDSEASCASRRSDSRVILVVIHSLVAHRIISRKERSCINDKSNPFQVCYPASRHRLGISESRLRIRRRSSVHSLDEKHHLLQNYFDAERLRYRHPARERPLQHSDRIQEEFQSLIDRPCCRRRAA